MPFQKHVYYPLANSPEGPEVSAAGVATMAFGPPSSASGPLPFFQFRPRLENVDWRRLSAIDVDKVAGAVDILTLQENIMNITFCKLEDEKCPHCQSGVDPMLLKLIRLAQLTIEYLMHSQEFLTSQLNVVEERLRLSLGDYEQSKQLLSKQASEIRLLKEECKRRKKMLSTQQLMIEAKASYYQCHFCDKAFMNQAFLQSHIQRRHPADSHLEYNTKAHTDKLQKEVDMLKEQLQMTRSQLESAQHTYAFRVSKEYEMQKTKEDDFLKLFDRWKEEEKEKLLDEMEKVKEMFMKEFKELTSKNSALEYQLLEIQKSSMHLKPNIGPLKEVHEFKEDHLPYPQDFQNMLQLIDIQASKWTDRFQVLNEEHSKEKDQLLSHIEKLQNTMMNDLSADNVFYKKRVEELGKKLQEQNELIITQRQQIREFASKPHTSINELKGNPVAWQVLEMKPVGPAAPMSASSTQTLEGKSSLTMVHDQIFSSHVLEPIEELSSEEEKGRENEQKLNKKTHLRKTSKTELSPKQLRINLEKKLMNKLKFFGIDADIHGIPCEILNKTLRAVNSARHDLAKQVPNIQQIREQLEHQLICKVEKKILLSSDKHRIPPVDTLPTEEVSRATQIPPKSKHLVRQRPVFTETVAIPKVKKNTMEDHFPRKCSSTKTPPFSSEEEVGEEDFIQSYISPDLITTQPPKNTTGNFGKCSVRNDMDWTEGSETEDSEVSLKPTGTSIQIQTENAENKVLHQASGNKPVGGIKVAETFKKKEELQEELKCADVDDDDWDISSLEEEKPLGKKPEQREPPPVKRDLNSSHVPRAWGPVNPREFKEEGLQENETSTLKSSLVTMTDWSDFLDV